MKIRKFWTRHVAHLYRGVVPSGDENPTLEQAYVQLAGQWLAVDRKTGEVVAAQGSPYALSAHIKSEGLRGVDVVRAPSEHEPEMVGFG